MLFELQTRKNCSEFPFRMAETMPTGWIVLWREEIAQLSAHGERTQIMIPRAISLLQQKDSERD